MTKQKVSRKKKADPSRVKKQTKAGQIIKQKVVINLDKPVGGARRGRRTSTGARAGRFSKPGINKPQSDPIISRFNIPNIIVPPGGGGATIGSNNGPPPNDDFKKQLKQIQDDQSRIERENKHNFLMLGVSQRGANRAYLDNLQQIKDDQERNLLSLKQSQTESMGNLVGNINQQAKQVFDRLNKLESVKSAPSAQMLQLRPARMTKAESAANARAIRLQRIAEKKEKQGIAQTNASLKADDWPVPDAPVDYPDVQSINDVLDQATAIYQQSIQAQQAQAPDPSQQAQAPPAPSPAAGTGKKAKASKKKK